MQLSENQKSFGTAFASLAYADRFPTWTEYTAESPAAQRAIIARWWQIAWNPWCEKFGQRGIEALRLWKQARVERGESINFSSTHQDDEPRGFNDDPGNYESQRTGSMKSYEWGE